MSPWSCHLRTLERRLPTPFNARFLIASLWWALVTIAVLARPLAAERSPGPPRADANANWLSSFTLSQSAEPVFLKANRLEFDYKNRVLVYRGNVEVRQADARLFAEEVHVALSGGEQFEIREIRARGNVRLEQGERWAQAREAVFDQFKRVATLNGDAVLHDGRNEVQGERVILYLDEQRSIVEGGKGRVQAVFYPGKLATPTVSVSEGR